MSATNGDAEPLETAKKRPQSLGRGNKAARQDAAAMALAEGLTIKDAAARVGMGESTLRHWLDHDPAFQESLEETRQSLHMWTILRLAYEGEESVDALRDMRDSKWTGDAARVSAARALLELAFKSVAAARTAEEVEELREQVEELKRQVRRVKTNAKNTNGATRPQRSRP